MHNGLGMYLINLTTPDAVITPRNIIIPPLFLSKKLFGSGGFTSNTAATAPINNEHSRTCSLFNCNDSLTGPYQRCKGWYKARLPLQYSPSVPSFRASRITRPGAATLFGSKSTTTCRNQ